MESGLGNFASNPTTVNQSTAPITNQSSHLLIKDERKSLTKNKRKKSRVTDEDFQFGISFNLFPLVDPINLFTIQQFLQSRALNIKNAINIYKKFI